MINWLPMGVSTSTCDGCQKTMFWIEMFDKKHPFNSDGGSHVQTCASLRYKNVSIGTLGDINTFYRERWREMFLGDANGFKRDGLSRCDVPPQTAVQMATVLRWYGGPLRSHSYPVEDIVENIHWGGRNGSEELIAMSVDKWIWWGLRRCLPPEANATPVVYKINGIYIVNGSS